MSVGRLEADVKLCKAKLFVNELEGGEARRLLREWDWLLDRPMRPLCMTAFGDWFLEAKDDGSVHFLDAGIGEVKRVASSRDSWRRKLCDPKNHQKWLLAGQLRLLLEAGCEREPGGCYSFRIPPSAGGSLELDNFDSSSLELHQVYTSCTARRVRGLPPGTPVTEEIVADIQEAVEARLSSSGKTLRALRLAAVAAGFLLALSLLV